MIDTENTLCGSRPLMSAKWLLRIAPNMPCGDLEVETLSTSIG